MVVLPNIIWIDPNIDGDENSAYISELQSLGYFKIKRFKDIYEALDQIKNIEFEETIIIVSGSLYIPFIQEFKKNLNDIYVIPKIIIFAANKEKFIQNNIEYQNIINDPFYNIGGVHNTFGEIKNFIINPVGKNKVILKRDDEGQLTFEYIDNKEKLALPLFYKSLIELTPNDKIEQFTQKLYNKYCKNNKELESLLSPIINMKDIPIELLSKYYTRIYTTESNFYTDLNNNLRDDNRDNYLPYIKVLYEGVKLNSLPLASNDKLYRGTRLSNIEIDRIQYFLANKKEGLPGAIVFSKTFSSFSKDRKIAENFLNTTSTPGETKMIKSSKVLFILEKDDNLDFSLSTHADIEKISFYPVEREVLFFPFSSFEIQQVNEVLINNEKRYEIRLLYLGKYLTEFKPKIPKVIPTSPLPNSYMTHQQSKSPILTPKSNNFNLDITNRYEQYKGINNLKSPTKNNIPSLNQILEIEPNKINKTKIINIPNNIIPRIPIPDNIPNNNIINNSFNQRATYIPNKPNIFNNIIKINNSNEINKEKISDENLNKVSTKFTISDLPDSEFKKQILKSGLIKKEKIQTNKNTKQLLKTYEDYKTKIDININKKKSANKNKINKNYTPVHYPKTYIIRRFNIEDNDGEKIKRVFPNNQNKQNTIQNTIQNTPNLIQPNLNIPIINTNNFITNNQPNFIDAEINIGENDVNKYIRIINSFEEYKRNHINLKVDNELRYKNEKEIMDNCEIKIGEKKINFFYFIRFSKPGNYKIKYTFINNLTKTDFMFADCSNLHYLDLLNFNTQYVTNMACMFYRCNSLDTIKLSNLYTKNVTDMSSMFNECESLTNLDLSFFNTQNVTNMSRMFFCCKQLKALNVSNFNTQNVINMYSMFTGCESLKELDLSSFDTQHVKNMSRMFSKCSSLTYLNISNFSTLSVEFMYNIFSGNTSLAKLNITNFNPDNISNMEDMFYGCISLQPQNIICKRNMLRKVNYYQ